MKSTPNISYTSIVILCRGEHSKTIHGMDFVCDELTGNELLATFQLTTPPP